MADDELRRLERLAPTDPLAAERLAMARARAGRTPPVDQVASATAALDEVEALARALRGHASGAALAEVARGRLRLPAADLARSRTLATDALGLLRADGPEGPGVLSSRFVAAGVLARTREEARGLREVDDAIARPSGPRPGAPRWGRGLIALGAWPAPERVTGPAARFLATASRDLAICLREDGVAEAVGRLGLVDTAATALRAEARGVWWLEAFAALCRLERAHATDAETALEALVASVAPAELFQAQLLATLLDLAQEGPRDRCLAWAEALAYESALPVRLAQLRRGLARGTSDLGEALAFQTRAVERAQPDVAMRVVVGVLGAAAASGRVDEEGLAGLARRGLDARSWEPFNGSEVLQAAAGVAARLPTLGLDLLEEVARRTERLVADRERTKAWWLGLEALGSVAEAAGDLSGSEAGRRLFDQVVRGAVDRAARLARPGRGEPRHEQGAFFAGQCLTRAALAAGRRGDEALARDWREAAEFALVTEAAAHGVLDLARGLARAAEESAPAARPAAVVGATRSLARQVARPHVADRLHGTMHCADLAAIVADLVDAAVSLATEPTP